MFVGVEYYRAINNQTINTTDGEVVKITANEVIEVYEKKYYPFGTEKIIVKYYLRTDIKEYENMDLSYLSNFIKIN